MATASSRLVLHSVGWLLWHVGNGMLEEMDLIISVSYEPTCESEVAYGRKITHLLLLVFFFFSFFISSMNCVKLTLSLRAGEEPGQVLRFCAGSVSPVLP